ncbi:MAG: type II secretion system F family protein [Candidatus Taylorbacteria bacterium]|nr:type II secretion system F family protein [Candidatus Taylorbacteria bacterium]
MKFSYTAINKEGKKYTAFLEAQNKSAFFEEFKKTGDVLVNVQEAKNAGGFSLSMNITFLERVKMLDKITFARNLGNMIEAGLALSRALTVAERQTQNPKLKRTYKALNESIAAGKSFHEALEQHPKIFSNLFVAMVKVGEEGGNLAETLKQVANQMEKSFMLQKKIKGAMMYPSVIIGVMVIIAILMMMFVVPGLTKTFKELNVPLPTSTKIVIAVSDFASNHYIATFAIMIAAIVSFIAMARTRWGKRGIDYVTLKLPVIGTILKEGNSAQTARTLSSLLSSGVDLLLAVKITGDVLQNSYYKELMKKSESVVEKGEPLSNVFIANEKLYPVFVGEMMSVGEETGRMAAMLTGIATFYENEVEQKTKDLSTIIEPILMVFIGGSVGFFAISMIKPIYSIMNNV